MIAIATTVCPLARMPLVEVLWQLPAAIAYQIYYLHWQREGRELRTDDRDDIRRSLCQRP
jgi:hypothetical protein